MYAGFPDLSAEKNPMALAAEDNPRRVGPRLRWWWRQMVESAPADLSARGPRLPSVSVDNWRGKIPDACRAPTYRRRRFAHAFPPRAARNDVFKNTCA